MTELPATATQCPRCHQWGISSGYEPGATWAECPACGWKAAVPDEDFPGLASRIESARTENQA